MDAAGTAPALQHRGRAGARTRARAARPAASLSVNERAADESTDRPARLHRGARRPGRGPRARPLLGRALCGVKVLRFSVGMGKSIWSRRFGPDQTEWAVSILPLGGYVKMLDEREADLKGCRRRTAARIHPPDGMAAHRHRRRRPARQFLLAIAVFAGLLHAWHTRSRHPVRAVPQHTAAYKAGLRGGELVTAVNGEPVRIWSRPALGAGASALEKTPLGSALCGRLSCRRTAQRLRTCHLCRRMAGPEDLEGDFLTTLGIDACSAAGDARSSCCLTARPSAPALRRRPDRPRSTASRSPTAWQFVDTGAARRRARRLQVYVMRGTASRCD